MAKNLSRTVTIYINGKEVTATLKDLRAEVRRLENEQAKLPIGSQKYIEKSKELARVNSILREQKEAVGAMASSWDKASVKLTTVANVLQAAQAVMAMGDAAIGSVKDLARDFAELDDVYADVIKTTGLTHKEVEALNDSFQQMDTRTSREQLNQLAYEAGKLGINTKESVEQFVSASDKINIALGDVLGDGAMVTVGKLADIYKSSTEQLASADLEQQMLKIGSAINMLGQSSTANEAYMIEFMKRLGGIAGQAGLSADQILAFSSALDQNGMAVEMSATAFQKLLQQMIKKPQEFVAAAGVPMEEFKRMLSEDMYGAVMKVLDGMNKQGSLDQLIPIFQDMGLDGARAASVIASLAGSLDKVREAQAIANEELNNGASIISEFNTKNSTAQAEAEKAKKRFQDMRVELGEQLYPVVVHLTKASTVALKGLSGYLNLWKENKVAAASLTTALVALVAIMAKNTLLKAKDTAIMLAQKPVQAVHNMQLALQAKNETKLAAAKEAERVATLKARIEEEKTIVAKYASSTATIEQQLAAFAKNKVMNLEIALTKQEAAAEVASAAATKAKSAAMAATPWGAIIAGATALVFALSKLIKHSRRFADETRALNKEVAQESTEANYLFGKLETLEEGTDDYNKALKQLNDMYPDILSKYTDENGKLIDLAAARQAVIDKIREEIIERRRLDTLSDIEGDLQDKLGKYQEKLHKVVKSQKQYNDIMAAFNSGNITKAMQLAETAGSRATALVFKMDMARRDAEKEIMRYEEVYGPAAPASSSSSPAKTTSTSSTSETAVDSGVPDAGKADKQVDKWKQVMERAQRLLDEYKNKTATGVAQLTTEIDAKTAEMVKDIEESVGGSASEKQSLIGQIQAAGEALKQSKVADYLAAMEQKMADMTKAGETNQYMKQVTDASAELAKGLAAVDEQMAQLQLDRDAVADDSEEAKRIDALISRYNALKKEMQAVAYLAVDLSVDTSDFALTGDTFADYKKYNELTTSINQAREAATLLLEKTTDPAQREELEALMEDYDLQQQNIDAIITGIDTFNDKLERSKAFDKLIDRIKTFSDYALEAFGSINDILDNISDRELKEAEQNKEEREAALDEQLDHHLISQERYEAAKNKIEAEYAEKEKEVKLEQWRREKALNTSQAGQKGALAIMDILAKNAGNPLLSGILVAATAATTALQIGSILSEPAPYAKGGYTKEPTILVGERGQEWVAPNRMLTDPVTAPVISALEAYRRDPQSVVNMTAVGTAGQSRRQSEELTAALYAKVSELSDYLSDPNNRRAVISRRAMETFDANETFLRNQAKI